MVNRLNHILEIEFNSLEDILKFYRENLPKRVKDYRLEEVGPIMSKGTKVEIEGYINNVFSFCGLSMDMSNGIDWYGTPNGDLEWNGGFVRQGYFMYLADEYEKTDDEKYAETIINHMLDYIEKMPRYNPEGKPYLEYKKSTWRPFEVAGRVGENWPVALSKIINSKSMTPESWARILLSIYDHADFLSKYHWRTGNHACLEVADLGIVSIFYKEFKNSSKWLKYSIDFLMGMWEEEFYEDGYTKEMSGGYHWVAMRNFFAFYEVGKNNGYEEIFPKKYIDNLYKAGIAEFYQEKPDYSIPITNDSNTSTNRKIQLEKIANAFNVEEIKYRLTDGNEGVAPSENSYFYPETRIGVMRSDWSKKALYMFIDMGDWGTNHMNEDQLNIEVSAYGRNFLANSGRWRYTTSPGITDWLDKAKYFKATASYNSVIVDGYNQVPGNAKGNMIIKDDYDFAEGIFDAGYGTETSQVDEKLLKEKGLITLKEVIVKDVIHKRQAIFVKPYFWIVRDTIISEEEHEAEQIWHYISGEVKTVNNGQYVCTEFEDANLILAQPEVNVIKPEIFKGNEEPFRGWHCPYYDQLQEAPEVSYKSKGKGEIVFHTLIFPIQGKIIELPKFNKLENGEEIAYEVSYGGKKHKILAPKSGEWTLK
ncbi:hypothetical protein SH2C18_18570 [Clostridium sediminicola]|uniref:heparinase II/III family protein n=1 Tax=Clostridium sediminicola TaxID=3114879 RepID=UPI0031F1F33C